MIIVTGGAGFIGSATIWELNNRGTEDIIVVDDLRTAEKWKNLNGLAFADIYNKAEFLDLLVERELPFSVEGIIHLGACSATTEKDADYLLNNNYKFSQELVRFSAEKGARFIYASSAATYGEGENGYDDNEEGMEKLRPLNMYGYSKHLFDLWLKRTGLNDKAVGLKYFNVYGPNEYHKDDMRSVVHKAFEQVRDTGKVKLFKSHKDEYKDGEQMRDFVYVKDAVNMSLFFLENRDISGLFNVGTGEARTWNALVTALFNAMGKPVNIEYVDMPDRLKGKYQYYTKADNSKIRAAGFNDKIGTLEEGVTDYVKNYLLKKMYLGM